MFLCALLIFEKRIPTSFGFSTIALQIYREILKKYRKRAITLRKITFFFKYYCFRTCPGPKGNFMPKGIPIGFDMAEKNVNSQTNKHFVFILVDMYRGGYTSIRDALV